MPPLSDKEGITIVGDCETTLLVLSQSRRMVHSCLKRMLSYATALRKHFPSMAIHSHLQAVLDNWFWQRITISLQSALAYAIHSHTIRLKAASSSLSTLPRVFRLLSVLHSLHVNTQFYYTPSCPSIAFF